MGKLFLDTSIYLHVGPKYLGFIMEQLIVITNKIGIGLYEKLRGK